MINKVILIGRLTKDPELRKSNSDVSFASFDLAVDNAVKESDGTRGTCFITCKVFGVTAENLVKYCRKGSKVAIDGSLNQRRYEAKDGSNRTVIEVIVDSVDFLEPKKEANVNLDSLDLPEDDLPFKAEETKPQQKSKKSKKTSKKAK